MYKISFLFCSTILLMLFSPIFIRISPRNKSEKPDTITIHHKDYTTTFSKTKRFPVAVKFWLTRSLLDCEKRYKCGSVAIERNHIARVTIPDYCWKIICIKRLGIVKAYSFRNDMTFKQELHSFEVSLDSIRNLSGFLFSAPLGKVQRYRADTSRMTDKLSCYYCLNFVGLFEKSKYLASNTYGEILLPHLPGKVILRQSRIFHSVMKLWPKSTKR